MGDYPVLSRMIDSCPSNFKFIIALGYKDNLIKEYLQIWFNQFDLKMDKILLTELILVLKIFLISLFCLFNFFL